MALQNDKPDLALMPVQEVGRQIMSIRRQRVMLDADLAALYGVSTRVLNQAVKRNIERFPEDFMFQLTSEESSFLRSQTVTLKTGRGQHRKYLPYAFTEHGALMAASVLNTPRAVQMSVFVVRAFIRLRDLSAGNKELAAKLAEHEKKLITHDRQIVHIVEAIKQLTAPPPVKKKRAIGFRLAKE
jgi:hypothetical protein